MEVSKEPERALSCGSVVPLLCYNILTLFSLFRFSLLLCWISLFRGSIMTTLWVSLYRSGLASEEAKKSSDYWQRFHAKNGPGDHSHGHH